MAVTIVANTIGGNSMRKGLIAAGIASIVTAAAFSGVAIGATTAPTKDEALAALQTLQDYVNAPVPTVTETVTVTATPAPTVTLPTPTTTPTATPTPTPTNSGSIGSLPYSPPAGYQTYTVRAIPSTGGTVSLSSGVNYLLTCPAQVDKPVTITGGKNRVLIGCVFGGRTAVPSGSYDSTNRGIRVSDGDDNGVDYFEGLWFKPGYYSDAIQIAYRTNSNRDTYIQNVRVDGTTYGSRSGVHADNLQLWGGSRNLYVYNWTGRSNTYQGFFINNSDGRTVPTKGTFSFTNVNLVGPNATSYCFTDINPQNHNVLTASQFYCSGFAYLGNDSYGAAPAGVVVGSHPDFVPASLWSTGTYKP